MYLMRKAAIVLAAIVLGQYALAATPPEKAAPKAQAATQINAKSLELNEQGAKALVAKDFAAAENAFRDALNVDPGNVTAAYNLSGVYLVLKKNDLAKALLSEYLNRAPQDLGLNVRMGDTFFASRDAKGALYVLMPMRV